MITVGNTTIEINDLGFIESASIQGHQLSNIYSCLFKEHSLVDPSCYHYNAESNIQNLKTNEQECYFVKSFENYDVENTITCLEDGFDWKISFAQDRPFRHRIGI